MAFIKTNPNPKGNYVGDCVVRAISIATGKSWTETYMELALKGLQLFDIPSSNQVWGKYLKDLGYTMEVLPELCPDFYTVRDFCGEYIKGTYLLGTGTHVVTAIDGDYYDTWDSGDELPIYYWHKGD